jgi:hypothetical protein
VTTTNYALFPPERGRQDHCTPVWLAELIAGAFYGRIDCDPCSNPWSKVDAVRRVWLPEYAGHFEGDVVFGDGLVEPWSTRGLTYVNPPYGNCMPWVERAREWSDEHSAAHVVFAVPVATSARWWKRAWCEADAIVFWGRRIAWEGAGGLGAKQDTNLIYWGNSPRHVRQAFAPHGICTLMDR